MTTTNTTPTTIITAHVNADFDALASMVAAKTLYPEAVIVAPPYREKTGINYFLDSIAYVFNFKQPKDLDLSQVNKLVVVDTRQKSRIKHVEEVFANPGLKIHVYDHHPDSADDVTADFSLVKTIGATTTIIAQLMQQQGITPSPDEATMLALGLYEDTGSFTFNSTTPDDLLTGAWLLQHKADLDIVSDIMSNSLTSQQVLILNRMIESSVTHEAYGLNIVLTDIVLDEFVDDFAVLAHQIMDMENAQVILALAQMGDRVQLVARSSVPNEIDVGRLCASFGGGGHAYAAAASIKDKTITEIKGELLAMLFSTMNAEINVGAKMTSPAKVVEDTTQLSEADAIMLRYGLKAVPVVSHITKKCVGILEQQTAARAVSHKLGSQPVADYMHTEARTLSPVSSLYPAMDIILSQRQRLVPVVDEEEKVLGVLTRTDIMRLLMDESIRIAEGTPLTNAQKERNVRGIMKEKLPKVHFDLLEIVGTLADSLNISVYAVGGFVRDLLLDRVNLDIDITVEGSGIAFAEELAKKLNGRMRSHPKFQTALVIYTDANGVEQRVDVATARLEYYEYPGALPTVELSSIKMDLSRRDFTINALAVRLNTATFGQLVDPFGAQRDIKEKAIRVMHSLSFVEDPTRILRAVRFEKRFGFKLDQQSEKLVKNCLQLGFFRNLSGARLFNELNHIFDEKSPALCLERMEQLGLLNEIHPQLKLNASKRELIASTEEVISWYKLLFLKEQPRNWAVYLMSLCPQIKYPEMAEVLERLMFTAKTKSEFMTMREATRNAGKQLTYWQKTPERSMSELYKILIKIPLEGILHIMSQGAFKNIKKEISHFLSRLWHMTLEIDGEDIIAMGAVRGPAVGAVLKAALEYKAEGLINTREEQLAFAKKMLIEHNLISIEQQAIEEIISGRT